MVRKVYVEVLAWHDRNGKSRPMRILWEDGTVYIVERVLNRSKNKSVKVGGGDTRYTIQINGKLKKEKIENALITIAATYSEGVLIGIIITLSISNPNLLFKEPRFIRDSFSIAQKNELNFESYILYTKRYMTCTYVTLSSDEK